MKNIPLLLVFAIAFTPPIIAAPADDDLPVLTPRVKSVAAFKNGVAFVLKAGDTRLRDGWARMDSLPTASLGTLWLGATDKSGPITEVCTYKEKVADESDAVSLSELLSANVGHRVVLTYGVGTQTVSAEGKLLAAPDRQPPPEEPGSLASESAMVGFYRPLPVGTESGLVLLQVAKPGHTSVLSLPKTAVQSLEILDDANVHTRVEREQARTKFHLHGNPKHAEIDIAALEKGLIWSPSYRINLVSDTQADLELNAVFADDTEDLDDAEVSFVVGYPNFSFANILSPMSLHQSVAEFVQALAAGGAAQAGPFANVMSQSLGYNSPRYGTTGPNNYSAAPVPGEPGADLYFYRKSGVTLKPGSRASFNLLQASVPCEQLYQWEIPDSTDLDEHGYRSNPATKPENLVWHVLRLENRSQQPWTTAPALAVTDNLPVAQDTLGYTPPGGRNVLKLTVAADVPAEQSQSETDRKMVTLGHSTYDEVTVKGTLKITNGKSKEITLQMHKSLLGEVLEAPDGKVTKRAHNLTSVNFNSEIEWELKLPAGTDHEITYRYKVLLAR